MKKTIMVSAFFTAFNLNAESIESKYILKINDNNIFKVIEPVLTENQSNWRQISIDCDEWLPLANTIPIGNTFTQNRNCEIVEEATLTRYRDSIKISEEILSRTTESQESQQASGTKEDTNLIDFLPASSFSHSSAYNGLFVAPNAFDNNNSSRWESSQYAVSNQFITIDLLQPAKVKKFDYLNTTPWGGRSPNNFRIEGSNNGSTWTTYFTGTMPANLNTVNTFNISGVPDTGLRYWRIYFVNNHGDPYAIVANEINLYGQIVN